MKRSGPPSRKSRLKRGEKTLQADPEKTRAFVERSREKARERARDVDMRQARAKGIHPRAAVPAEALTMREALRTAFIAKTPANTRQCARCDRRAEGYHHLVPQQHIRTYVRGLRLTPQSTRAKLRTLLRAEENLVPLCWPCHDAHELGANPIHGEDVPHCAWVFALKLGPEWLERMRRMYRHAGRS